MWQSGRGSYYGGGHSTAGPRNALGERSGQTRPQEKPRLQATAKASSSRPSSAGGGAAPGSAPRVRSRSRGRTSARRKAAHAAGAGLLPYLPDSIQNSEVQVIDAEKPPLPVLAHREEVVQAVRENRVTILSGETGSGKTTQVPQFIIDDPDLVPNGQVVIVTQPRRIACITIAERVAQERGEAVGESVGYQIRFVNNTSPSTKLIFCTTAVLLRKLHSDPHFDRIAVLCVDEVHERDVNTEFLLLAVRERLLRGDMQLKLVLMSATLSAETFIDFFAELRSAWVHGERPDPDPRSCIQIEGRMFPVKEHFLEDALEWTGHELPNSGNAQRAAMVKLGQKLQEANGRRYSEKTLRSLIVAGERDVHQALMQELIMLFHNAALTCNDGAKGGILVFLPGWADISGMYERMKVESELWVLALHSQISPEEQQRVFDEPPEGRRKIVLSTNVAETSVTIDDIVFVINSGVMKERVFDAERQLGALEVTLNTWANATQRAGRAGRTQEGVVVHLFPSWKMAELRKWPTPEILSKSLEEVVLNLLALGLGDPHEVLSSSLSSPSVACVEHAVWLLQEMSMMRGEEGLGASDALMPLGRWLAPIPLHPMSSKALLYGALFGVLLPVTASVAFLNIKNPFVQPAADAVLAGGREVLARGKHSDHFAMAAAYLGWRAKAAAGEGNSFIQEHGLSRETLDMGDQLVRSLLRMMVDEYEYDGDDAAFADDADSGTWTTEYVFEDPRTWQFCKAALCAAFTPFFVRCNAGHLESDANEEVQAHASSCNHSYQPIHNPYAVDKSVTDDWAVYSDAMKLGKVSIMESTVVGAQYILLFSKNVTTARNAGAFGGARAGGGQIDFDGWRGALQGGEEAWKVLQGVRRDLHKQVSSALQSQTAMTLGADALDRLAETLSDGRLALKSAVGMRQQRIGEKEAATMFVGSVPDEADEEEIKLLFGTCGRVEEVSLVTDRETGARRGFGFVTMGTRREAILASQRLNGSQLHGRRLRIDLKGAQGKGKGKASGGPVTFAKPLERRNWIRMPTDDERRGIVEDMRTRALANQTRMLDDSRTAERKQKREDDQRRKKELEEKKQRERQEREAEAELSRKKAKAEAEERRRRQEADAEARRRQQQEAEAEEKRRKAGETPASKSGFTRWGELLVQSASIRIRKRHAVETEDFQEASRLKRQEAEVTKQITIEEQSAATAGNQEELQQLEVAKKRAVEEEDYVRASQLKKKIKAIETSQFSVEDLRQRAWGTALAMARALDSESAPVMAELQRDAPPGASEEKTAARLPVSEATLAPGVAKKETDYRDQSGGLTKFGNEEAKRKREEDEKRKREEAMRKVEEIRQRREQEELHQSSEEEARRKRAEEAKRKKEEEEKRSKLEEMASKMLQPQAIAAKKENEKEVIVSIKSQSSLVQSQDAPKLKVKQEEPSKQSEVKEEVLDCSVPGVTAKELMKKSNPDLWQLAWDTTWKKEDTMNRSDDQAHVYAEAQKVWRSWLAERDRLVKQEAAAEGRKTAEEIRRKAEKEDAASLAVAKTEASPSDKDPVQQSKLSTQQLQAQKAQWQQSKAAQEDWSRMTAEAEKRQKTKDDAPKTGRDLCAVVKQRCPADTILQFERLLAVCPKGTTVRQLVQAMAKEPQEFRQNWDGTEYCVRPVNSRCVDWLPVQASTTPPGFREDASLPEEMLAAAKSIFEERLKPQGQVVEDPLAQFLMSPGRFPPDTPLPFNDILKKCPPGTSPMDVVRTMSKRRDTFRQDSAGKFFCVKPRLKCKDWGAVNPYLDPTNPTPSGPAASSSKTASKLEPPDEDY